MSRGFSLIEMIVYVALLGLIMAGAIGSAYQITQNSASLNNKNTVQEEGNFVLRKIEQAFAGAYDISTGGSGCSQTLHVERYGSPSDIDIALSGDTVVLDRGTGAGELTTDNVAVSCLKFNPTAGSPKGVTAVITIGGLDFTLTKYVR